MTFRHLLQHTAVYGLSTTLNRAAGFFLIPVYTRFLSPDEYGVLALCQVLIAVLAIFYEMGVNAALFRHYFEFEDPAQKKELIGTVIVTQLVFSAGLVVVLIALARPMALHLLDSIHYIPVMQIISIATLMENLVQIPFIIMRANQRSLQFAALSFFKLVATLSLNILFVVQFRRGIQGIMESHLVTAALLLILMLPYLARNASLSFSKPKAIQALRFGLPLIPTNLIGVSLAFSDRYILKLFVSLQEIGFYSLGYKIGAIVNMVAATAVALAWPTVLMGIMKEGGDRQRIARMVTYLLAMVATLAICLSVFSAEIVALAATPKYVDARRFIPPVAFGYLFYAGYKLFESGIFISKKTGYYIPITGFATGLNVGLNFLLIPFWGAMAAAGNTLVSYFAMAMATLWVANRTFAIPYEYGRLIKLLIVAAGLSLIGYYLDLPSAVLTIAAKSVVVISFPIILLAAGFFNLSEVKRLRAIRIRLGLNRSER